MPLPPPPPPAAPPPLPTSAARHNQPKRSAGAADNRCQLLADIRTGAKLKKTVTNDRSAPVIDGGGGGANKNRAPAPPQQNLAALFAGGAKGMPKLKPAGNQPSPKHNIIPPGFGTVRRGFFNEAAAAAGLKPHAPLPPPTPIKTINGSKTAPPLLPSKPPNVTGSSKQAVSPGNKTGFRPQPPPKSPAVTASAQQPPALPTKPPNTRRRPQSFTDYDYNQRRGSVKVNTQTEVPVPPLPNRNAAAAPLTPKSAPPPPLRTTPHLQRANRTVAVTVTAPPPPPPPHRVYPPPPPPSQCKVQVGVTAPNCAPPPPPIRNSSSAAATRNSYTGSSSNGSTVDDFESRFYHLFLSVNTLPAPEPFTKCHKTYPSKNHGQRRETAPTPNDVTANVVQLGNKMWENPVSNC